MDSLFPFLQGLTPLQHVGLSRRTVVDRPSGRYQFWCKTSKGRIGHDPTGTFTETNARLLMSMKEPANRDRNNRELDQPAGRIRRYEHAVQLHKCGIREDER